MSTAETGLHVGVTLCLPYDPTSLRIVGEVMTRALELLGDDGRLADDMRESVAETCAVVLGQVANGDAHEVQVSIDERSCAVLLHDLDPT